LRREADAKTSVELNRWVSSGNFALEIVAQVGIMARFASPIKGFLGKVPISLTFWQPFFVLVWPCSVALERRAPVGTAGAPLRFAQDCNRVLLWWSPSPGCQKHHNDQHTLFAGWAISVRCRPPPGVDPLRPWLVMLVVCQGPAAVARHFTVGRASSP